MICSAILALLLQGTAPHSAPAINDTVMIDGAGTRLFLELRGRADSTPILLHLHGGPGNAMALVLFRAYVGPALESRVLVAYLHQRGVLRSPSVPDSAQTIANHIADVARVVNYLARRFPRRPIFLVGHSWGGYLAIRVALEHPEHRAGVVSVSGPFDIEESLKASYLETLAWERGAKNAAAVKALTALGPPPYTTLEQQITLSQWASSGNGGLDAHLDPKIAFGRVPYTAPDRSWSDRQMAVSRAMLTELFRSHVSDRLGATKLPLLVLVGSRDLVVPASSLRDGYVRWGGPKRFVDMEKSHHLPFVDEPARFVELVMAFVSEKHS